MIIAKVNGQTHFIYIIDAHSHIGHDVDGVANENPMAPFGTIDFYKKTYAEVIKETGGNQWSFTSKGKTYEFKITPHPPVYQIFQQAATTSSRYSKLMERMENAWMIDYGIGFPFMDTYRGNDSSALFAASNERVASVVSKFPVSLKMLGYCRVFPDEGQKAIDELRKSILERGLRGLKLHPRSEGWLDHINNSNAIAVLTEAAKMSLPVIFDTRGRQSVYDISELVKATKNQLQRNNPELLPHLKIIVGHCVQGHNGNTDVYNAISDSNTYGEISLTRSPEWDAYVTDFMHKSPAGKNWSKHLLFGSDFPYAFERHAKDVISYLVSKNFFDAGGNIQDVQNILGGNMLRLLPEYNKAPVQQTRVINPVSVHARSQNGTKARDIMARVVVKLLEDRDVDISKFVPVFDGSLRKFTRNFLVETTWNVNDEQKKVWFLMMKLIGDDLVGFGPVGNDGTCSTTGYSYFDPGGFKALSSLSSVHLVDDPDEGWKRLKTLFSKEPAQKRLKPIHRRPTKPMKGGTMRGRKPVKPAKK
ncbi:amidohydrolase family protein [Candidatus Bathyarchaeota archaeon]|nr:amidohydrolase family protein [Candidatus Bathyarchaeota archaeon]